MQSELKSLNESSDFTCPNCGKSVFEVNGSSRDFNNRGETDNKEFLLMKCLHCLQPFRHMLHDKESRLISSTP
jgi:predicted RNA-binding Zn-ribbon protein involved in translation (DUF1610 family)